MIREDVIRFLKVLGADDIQESEKWINCKCVLAPFTHGGGIDTRPSFGVSINDLGQSYYYCFGCTAVAKPVASLLHVLFIHSKRYPKEAAHFYATHECVADETKAALPPDPWDLIDKFIEVPPLPPDVVKMFPILQGSKSDEALRIKIWIERDRFVPPYIQNLFRLRYDYDRRAVVFPLTDHFGDIYVMRERRRNTKEIWTISPKIANVCSTFPKLSQVGVWFGMYLIDWEAPVMLVEGEFDAMRIASLGFYNVIASATSSVTDAQIDALKGDRFILAYDCDKAGKHAHRRIADRIGEKANIRIADWSVVEKKDGGDLEDEEQLEIVLKKLVDYS